MKITAVKYLLIITAFSFVFSCDTQKTGNSNFTRLNRWLNYYGLALNDFSDTLVIENNYSLKKLIANKTKTHNKPNSYNKNIRL